MNVTTKAFTLIELLIVVAIIAILAAIAVPNFLEAQTRSTISRTMADLRTVGIGLESYQVDNNNYPMPRWAGRNATLALGFLMIEPPDGTSKPYIGVLLTTPIAYLTSVPFSYYNSRISSMADNYRQGRQKSFWINCVKPGYRNRDMDNWIRQMRASLLDKFPHTVHWLMESAGPSLSWWHGGRGSQGGGSADPQRYLYDPTNGTISDGMIVYADRGWISGTGVH